MQDILGRVNSEESMGLVDGPGIRYVVFLQGCELRCIYCHNPETWDKQKNCNLVSPRDLVNRIIRYKNYFGSEGGVTFSGGEPLLQPKFLLECLKLCKENNINTAIDTSGVGIEPYDEILKYVDLVILDIKAVKEQDYKEITGFKIDRFNNFLSAVQKAGVKLWLRQVIVPGINDTKENIILLKNYAKSLKNVEKVELLPYRTLGVPKYKELNIKYRLLGVKDLSKTKLKELSKYLKD